MRADRKRGKVKCCKMNSPQTRAAAIADGVDFCLTRRQIFSNWVPLVTQLLELSISEAKLAFAGVTAEIKVVHITAFIRPLASTYPN
jgi:hypothetical protein